MHRADIRAVANIMRNQPAGLPTGIRRALAQTPRRLNLLGAVLAAAVAAFIAVLISGMSGADDGMSAISSKAAEAKATNDLYYHLNDMDAQAANALLVGFHPTGAVPREVGAAADMATYESERSAVDADLQLIGLNPALAAQDRTLLDALGAYESAIAQAVYIDQTTNAEKPAAPPPAALALYEGATASMHRDILTAARAIRTEDQQEIDASYTAAHDGVIAYAINIPVLGALLIAFLVGVNQYISRRFRRTVGPALAFAAVTVVAVAASAAVSLGNAAHQYRVAKQSAYDSISALTNAKAVSYDANAAESRWLLDRSASYQDGFFTDVDQIAHLTDVDAGAAAANPSLYYTSLNTAATGLSVDGTLNSVSGVAFSGFLGNELNNITFAGEAQGAYDTADAFNKYVQDDATIRKFADDNDLADAVTFDIGVAAPDSNYYFGAYVDSLQKIIDINQSAFTAAVGDGENGLSAWSWLPYVVGPALLALIALALYPRVREYR